MTPAQPRPDLGTLGDPLRAAERFQWERVVPNVVAGQRRDRLTRDRSGAPLALDGSRRLR
jgi:hypothetical protein